MSDITAFTLKTWYSPAFDFTSLARFGRGDGGEGVTNNLGESCSNKDLKNLILAKFSELDKKMEVGLARMDQKLEGDININIIEAKLDGFDKRISYQELRSLCHRIRWYCLGSLSPSILKSAF